MTNNELSAIREKATEVTIDGNYKVVIEKSIGGKIFTEVKMFGITKERAEEYSKMYQGGKVVEM